MLTEREQEAVERAFNAILNADIKWELVSGRTYGDHFDELKLILTTLVHDLKAPQGQGGGDIGRYKAPFSFKENERGMRVADSRGADVVWQSLWSHDLRWDREELQKLAARLNARPQYTRADAERVRKIIISRLFASDIPFDDWITSENGLNNILAALKGEKDDEN